MIALLLVAGSCRKVWEDHYDEALANLPGYNLFEYIQSDPDLAIFTGMLEATGYDSFLSASQSYTVWAPTDQALSGISLNGEEQVLEIVRNHIARGNLGTSGIDSRAVKMINGKNITFEREASGFKFGRMTILEANIITRNGQVHVLDGYVPYKSNILEFINRMEALDSLENFLNSQNRWIFDTLNSIEIGFDTAANVIYDSAFIFSNLVLNKLGALGTEDSIYTALLPDNNAWVEAYGRAQSYFNIPEVFGGSARQRMKIQWAIIQDMVFREVVTDPGLFNYLVSTSRNLFLSPADLFVNAQPYELSNGIAYITTLMPFADTASWFKTIRVEAEDPFGRDNTNSNIYNRTGLGSGLDISDESYIVVDPTGTSNIAQPGVRFSIPNTLSATYNIYCVFVPAYIVDPTNMLANRADFQLTYVSTTAGRTRRHTFTPENSVTDPSGLTKMFIGQFDFEFANVLDEDYREAAVKLQVTNDVTIEEENAGLFSRTMRIDCIILEPAIE